MAANVIELEGLSKRYRLGALAASQTTLREALPAALRRRGGGPEPEELWALRDVDLSVAEGEVLGIVGRNGAGKSTLLKLVARITEPTHGRSRTRGRVGALLEVGTGFHAELSGRENVYVNGAILGMSRREVRTRFDEIVEFAGLERFIDTPLKRYSSGMQLRLAFAVAAHIQPEIVVVDEVLAVGDFEFQRQCLNRMSEMGRSGRTVLFVSHDQGAVARLCSRAIWLEHGRVVADGRTEDVLADYLRSGVDAGSAVQLSPPGDRPVSAVAAEVARGDQAAAGRPRRGDPLRVSVTLRLRERVPGLDLALYLQAEEGTTVLSEGWSDTGSSLLADASPGDYVVTLVIPPVLRAGTFTVSMWLGTQYETLANEHLMTFDLEPRVEDRAEQIRRDRVVQPPVEWRLESAGDRTEATA